MLLLIPGMWCTATLEGVLHDQQSERADMDVMLLAVMDDNTTVYF